MSVTSFNGRWFEPTPRRLLDSNVPVSQLMTTSAQVAALAVQWPRHPSVSVLSASDLFRWVAGDEDDEEAGRA